ncbi:MAG TPA: MBG domain-containing protein [Blastocatellia bacterium]|nr:MBG domain-containing protein [Blastocatellia bacterium]
MHISSFRTRTLLVLCLAVLIFGTLSLKADRVFTMSGPLRSAATNEPAQSPRSSAHPDNAVRGRRFANYFSLASPALVPGPVLSLLKSHTLTSDVNANGYVNPGDTLQYSVTITNSSSDATSATFSETIDANATLVPGSISTTPVAVNDSYSTIGNVSISVPAGSGLLANDFDPDGDTLTITAVNTSSLQGTLSYNAASGSFSFDPTPGYEGTTSFTYTVSDGTYTDTATVSITVSGMIWFVDNSRGTNGDGRLSNPFNSLATFNSANNGTGNNPAANDNIFLYSGSGSYASNLTLLSGQKLIGQGATASLSTITGLTPNSFSATLPSTGGTRPAIAGTVALHNSTTARGLNITPSSGTAGLTASGKSSVSVSEVSVTTTNATAVNFSSITNGTFSFTSISASGGSNGIILSSTTGSFTVTGNGGTCTSGSPTCSGGTIQNTTGADGASSGIGISLSGAQNVSLSLMRISGHSNFGIKGSNVNGLTMANCLVDGANGTSNATDDGAIYFGGGGAGTGLYGTVSITNCDISGGWEDNFHVDNSDGTLNLTLTGCNIHDNSASGGNDGLFVEADTTASVTVTANNNTFSGHAGDHFQASAINSATLSVTFQNNNLSGGHPNALGQGITIGGSAFNGSLSYNVSNNTMTGTLAGGAINISQGSGTANFNGTISGNTIGNPAIASSGTTQSTAIRVENHGSGTHTAVITGNAIRQYDNGNGIDIVAGGSGANGGINVSITNNTLSNPGANALHGVQVNIGITSGNTNQACIDIQNNTLAGSGVALNGGYDVYLRQRNLTTVRLPGYSGANNNNSAVATFVQGNNPGSETALASNSVSTGGGGFTGGAACAQPSIAPPADFTPAESQQSGGQVSALRPGAIQPSFWSRAKQTLLSAFIAPTGYSRLSRAFDALMPVASAAELKSAAAIGAASAGDVVIRNFAVIPAGKSITIRYRVTVNSPFPQGVYQISSQGALSGSNFATVQSNADATAVIVAPTISKAFGATAMAVGGSTSLTFTLTNPNPSQSLSSVAFTDNLPSGLVVATPNGLSSTCSGTVSATAGASSVSLTGGALAAGSTCTISVNVTGTSEGTKNNTTSTLTSAEADAGSAANASINVINPPTLSASFGAATIPLNGSTSLSFTVTNPNSTFSLNGLGFTLSLPAGLQVASPDGLSSSCNGTVTATAGTGTISLSGGGIAAGSSCTFSVNVTGTTAGVKNASTTIAATETGNGNTASASLTVVAPPTISAAFGAASVSLNGSTTLSYTISNPNATVALSGVAFSNSLPAGLVVATPNGVSGSCSGTVTATAGTGTISLSGGGIAAGSSCTISVNVTGTSAGTKSNTTGAVTSTEGGTGAASNTATLTVLAPPTLGNYSAASLTAGGNTTVTPDAAPTDLTSITAAAAPGFTGLLTVNPTTGVVRVTNALPAGSHTITVTATGSGGTATKTFTLTVSDPSACTSASFAAPTIYPVSGGPNSVAAGDFNGDGKQDLATANPTSNTVSIRLGDGAGGFSGSTEVSVGSSPLSVAIGDFNGDGKQDFATANESSNTVSIRLGDGTGGFTGSTEISVGVGPRSVAIGDFNGDGKQDIAVASFGSNSVSIRLGDGAGGFSGSTAVSVGAGPFSVALGDFNGDSKLDFATANSPDNTVSIRLGDGAGGFSGSTVVSVGNTPDSVAVGDFNSDGKQDIATANQNSNTVSIRLGDGAGGFSGSTEISVGDLPQSVALGDFNGDGRLDFAAACSDSVAVSVRLGNGTGGFSGSTEISLNGSPSSVAVGDFNGDGRLDLAGAGGDSAISVMLSDCTNNTAPTITPGSTVSRTQGTAAANSTLATVSDNETAAGSLTVTATTVPTGIIVSNITNTNGTITADIAAGCTATTGDNTVVLTVTDGGGMTTTANLTVSVAANAAPTLGNYAASTVVPGGSLTVTPDAAPTDNGTIATLTAAAPNFTGTLSINAATGAVSLSNAGPTGTYTVTVTATDNCGATSSRTFALTVSPAVTTTTVASALNPSTYGQATSFTATVTSGGNPVNTGTVTFKDGSTVLASNVSLNSNGQASLTTSALTAGLHTITAEYSGTATLATSSGTVSQTVNKAVLTVTADNKSKVYGAANPTLTATITGFVGSDTASVITGAASLTTTATTASGVGTYPITAAQGTLAAANYSFSFANGTLSVSAATITVTASNATRAYGAANPTFTATYSGFVNGDTQAVLSGSPALSTTATTSTAAGTYTITAAQGTLAAANYSFAFVNGTLTIGKATLTVTADNKSKAYGAALPTLTASYSGFVNGDTASVLIGTPSLTTTATTGSAVGAYPITAAVGTLAAANYTFSFVNGTLSVTTATLTITADSKSKTYGSANPTLTVSYSGFVNGDTASSLSGTLSVTTTALQGSGVGVYPITASGLSSGNYAISYVSGSLTVNKAPLTVTANNQTKVYGAANPALTYAITGFVNGETASVLTGAPSVTTTATTASGVGSYPITAAIGTLAAANYSFSFVSGTLSVTPATLSVIADSKSKVYGAANPTLTASYSGFVNGDSSGVLSGTPSLATTALQGSNAGVYPITVSAGTLAAANYIFSFVNSTLTVNKAPLTVTADNKTRLYGANNPTFTVSYSGFVNGDTTSVLTGAAALTTTATANSPVGSYPITAAAGTLAAANYTFTFVNGTLNVTTVTLTVTADNKSKTYGSANPTLTVSYSGFVNGDTASVLTGTPNITTTATTGSAVGTYPITVTAGTLNSSNYVLVFVDGTLTVSKAALTVTADSRARAYGVANPALTGTLSGVVNGDNITATYTTVATTLSPAGSYAITPALSDPGNKLGNYTVTTTNGVLTVTKAVLTVTADNKSKVYGAANPTLTASYSGFVGGDTAAVVTGAPALTTTATTASGAGTYPITAAAGTLAAANYTFTFANGALTVNKATLTVTADDKTRVYGAANPTFTASYSGFVNGDTASALTGAAALTTTATTSSAVGDYAITAAQGTLAAANYSFSFTAGKLTVTKAALTVKANDAARAYGAANPTFTGTITGLVSGDNITASYTTTATASSAPGDYAITPSLADPAGRLGNYNVTLTNGKLTVGKATLTITADNKSKVFGAANPAFTVSYSGFVNGDTASVLTGTLSLTTTATANSATGTYPITPAGVTAANYAINFVNGTLTVTAATPTATLASGSNPSAFGQAVTFTVTVSKASQTAAAPTGTVTFRDGANAIGTATLNAAGQATLTTSALTVGAHSLTAEYAGDSNYNAAVSAALTQTVSKAATTTTVASSVNPSTFNQSVTFTATVSSTAGTPIGSVEFRDGSAALGTATLANGKATLTVTTLAVGDHSITAVYGGSSTFDASASGAITQTVKEVCTWTISPVEQLAYETGGDFEVSVTTRSDCPWTAASNVAWITIKSGANGTGNGKVIYSVTPLPGDQTRTGTLTIAGQTFTVKQTKKVVVVNSASYDGTAVASDSFVSIFGVNLTDRTEAASSTPLPDTLAGVKIKIRDSQGKEHFARMLYASPTQINYIMPSNLPPGPCAVFIVRANEEIAGGTITVAPVAPALLSADASGKGLPAAYLVRVKADGSQVIEPVARYDEGLKQFVPVPVDLGSGNEEVFVILFGTGLRYRSDLKNVGVKIGGVDTAISYAGEQGSFIGLDQINVLIPRSLAGRGEVDVVLTVDGKTANALKLNIR